MLNEAPVEAQFVTDVAPIPAAGLDITLTSGRLRAFRRSDTADHRIC